MYSARKIQYRKYKLKKEPISNPLSFREINKNNNNYKNWNNEYTLPLILKNKIIHEIYKVKKDKENDFISISGMINAKKLNDHKKNK